MIYQKEILLKTAIDLLNEIEPYEPETVDIDSTTYDDGSFSLTITVNHPIYNEDTVPSEIKSID